MDLRKTISYSLKYKFFHFFHSSKCFISVKNELNLNKPSYESFLIGIKQKEGRSGVVVANIILSIIPLCLSILLDVYNVKSLLPQSSYIGLIFIFCLFTAVKFNYIIPRDLKNVTELIFSVLSLYFTGLFGLTFFALLVFENSASISFCEALK